MNLAIPDEDQIRAILNGPDYFDCHHAKGGRIRKAVCVERQTRGLRTIHGNMHVVPIECRQCGALECVKTSPGRVTKALGPLFAERGLPLEDVRVEAYGTCRACARRSTTDPGRKAGR